MSALGFFYIHRGHLFLSETWIMIGFSLSLILLALLITPELYTALQRARKWFVALFVAMFLAVVVAGLGAVPYVVLPAPCSELPWYVRILFPECW